MSSRLKKLLSLVLVFVLVFQMMPASAFADGLRAEGSAPTLAERPSTLDSIYYQGVSEAYTADDVLWEIDEKRTETEKHFHMANGSDIAVSYAFPVHYMDDEGEYQEIDNSLKLYNADGTLSTAPVESGLLQDVELGNEPLDSGDAEPVATPVPTATPIPEATITPSPAEADSVVSEEANSEELTVEDAEELLVDATGENAEGLSADANEGTAEAFSADVNAETAVRLTAENEAESETQQAETTAEEMESGTVADEEAAESAANESAAVAEPNGDEEEETAAVFLIAVLLLTGCGKDVAQRAAPTEANSVQTDGKTKLVIATISSKLSLMGLDNTLSKTVSRFNQENPDYYVEILDYSQNGTISQEDALTKLNTEIISGKLPADMLCFSNISPYPYITRSLMLELQEKISQDPSFSLEDIAALKAFFVQDGLYFLGSSFIFTTAVGDSSNFGDRYGWTLQEYLDFEASNPEGWIIYNITQDYFFRCVASRYMRTAIDWQAGTCDFDNANFIGILEASKRIMDKPESDDHILYASGGDSITSGELIVDFIYVTNFYNLAQAQRNSSCKLSYVGWPTADGSCGTDIDVSCPVGILAQSNNIDGCWEFLKYMVMSGGDDYSFSI